MLVSGFLQRMLNSLNTRDPFLLANSEVLVKFLESGCEDNSWGFSTDVQDLYYLLPHDA